MFYVLRNANRGFRWADVQETSCVMNEYNSGLFLTACLAGLKERARGVSPHETRHNSGLDVQIYTFT